MNIKKEIGKYLRKWPWILLSMAIFYTAAKIYLRYAQPQYYTKTSLKLLESKGRATSALNDLKNLGMGVSGSDELQGETQVIVSKPILQKVAKNLNLDVSFSVLVPSKNLSCITILRTRERLSALTIQPVLVEQHIPSLR
ncbi:hypothetical protein LDL59_03495 [Kaistella anthropi]|nr:hypothetical protein [Kaistella anthropi]